MDLSSNFLDCSETLLDTSLQVLVKHPNLRPKELLTLQSMLLQRVKVRSRLVFTLGD